jgi:hypothetical protein
MKNLREEILKRRERLEDQLAIIRMEAENELKNAARAAR